MAKLSLFERRRRRVRTALRARAGDKPRLSVHRTGKHIYAQIIDADGGTVLVSASTVQKAVGEGLKGTGNVDAAKKVGQVLAERAKEKGIETVAFDRSGYRYHGRVKALAAAARGAGLNF